MNQRLTCRMVLAIVMVGTLLGNAADLKSELADINPITIHFQPAKEVFVKTEGIRDAVTNAVDICMQKNEFQLNATIRAGSTMKWCRRVSENSYTDAFTENKTTIEELELLRSASVNVLTNLMGEPPFMEGAVDWRGTVVWQWRICNGKQPEQFRAIEVTIGFNPKNRGDVLFLLIRTGDAKRR
ncbi:MAG TPA: hypothetical protein VFY06_09255 [Verrucomicrobiae bacterium]|nr:hypothetical protein [Verrucomicrobiae bacterium]